MPEQILSGSSLQNPYKEFLITIPAYGMGTINYAFNYMRVLDMGGAGSSDMRMRFGETGSDSDLVGAGIGYGLDMAVNKVDIRNTSATARTLRIALAIGKIDDARFTTVGTINVSVTNTPNVSVTQAAAMYDYPPVAVGTTATLLMSATAGRKYSFFTNNDARNDVYIGSSYVDAVALRGVKVPPLQTVFLDGVGAWYGVCASGTVSVSYGQAI